MPPVGILGSVASWMSMTVMGKVKTPVSKRKKAGK